MKNNILLVITIFLLLSCENKRQNSEFQMFATLQNGDLIFTALPDDYSLADSSADFSNKKLNYIHVSIAEVQGDSIWIVDATIKRGVARYPLNDFLNDFSLPDGSHPMFIVKRLKDNSEVANFVEKAKSFVGKPYDVYFRNNNDSLYCSELVYNSYIDKNGRHLFKERVINFADNEGKIPQYWVELFGLLHRSVPTEGYGILPSNMITDACLFPVDVDITIYQ